MTGADVRSEIMKKYWFKGQYEYIAGVTVTMEFDMAEVVSLLAPHKSADFHATGLVTLRNGDKFKIEADWDRFCDVFGAFRRNRGDVIQE